MSFISVLTAVGKDFKKVLGDVEKYAAPVESLVGLIFPSAAPALAGVVAATNLIQNAVLVVEQKYSASGAQSGTGTQKLAEVLTLTQSAVTSLLSQAGIKADTSYITKIVNAVVAILNVQSAPASATS